MIQLELNKKEIEYLICCVKYFNRVFCIDIRFKEDINYQDLFEKLRKCLKEQNDPT